MKKKRTFMNLVPLLLMWLVLSVILWGFVFTRITTYQPQEILALYADGELVQERALAQMLYREGDGLKAVQVRPFSYAMFGGDELRNADLFIIPRENLDLYRECFAPWPKEMETEGVFHAWDGVNYGLKVYDAETKEGMAKSYILYENHLYVPQDYYLFFGNQSVHMEDGLAVEYANRLLNIE